MEKPVKHRDSFYGENSKPVIDKAWESFKDVIRPGNKNRITNSNSSDSSEKKPATGDKDREAALPHSR